jgi:hypothetical protein
VIDEGVYEHLSAQLMQLLVSQLSFFNHLQAKDHIGYNMSHQKNLSIAALVEEFYGLEKLFSTIYVHHYPLVT